MTTPQRATILFGHGSRDPLWHQPIQAVARQASQLAPHTLVRCAYLELTAPDLPACVQELAGAGVTEITITPMFLGVGRHAREDLPRLLDDLRLQYPHIRFQLAASVGEDARVIELLARIAVADE